MGYCKCTGEGCTIKEKCFRFTWKGNEYWQSWFTKPPMNENGECDHFMSNAGEKA